MNFCKRDQRYKVIARRESEDKGGDLDCVRICKRNNFFLIIDWDDLEERRKV